MKKVLLICLFLLAPVFVLSMPSTGAAQQPKLDIKVFVGVSNLLLAQKLEEEVKRDRYFGWQVGFGARIRRRQAFIEVQLSFDRWAIASELEDGSQIAGNVNSFELPLIMGYIPYKNPFFKLFLYAGFVNHFNTAYVLFPPDSGKEKFRIKDTTLAVYQAIGRLGVNFDLAKFNIDFNYSISLNSVTHTTYRTGYHQLQLNLGYLF